MAKITGNIFDYEINKGILLPPITILGAYFPHITVIATDTNYMDTILLKWKIKGSDVIHTHEMPNRELTMDEITTILVLLRIN